ncbi:MAG TPA: hypothetical protein ENK43_12890 [Planctomycetes bacterium]|nr:hypothetical protein [Planctomycetota bacterium]
MAASLTGTGMQSTSTFSLAGLLLLAALVVAGGIVAFWVLRFLQRRLRLFTRGTVTFMIVTLMVTTALSTFDYLHQIRRREEKLAIEMRQRAAATFLTSWIQGDRDGALMSPFVDEATRSHLTGKVSAIEDGMADFLQSVGSPAKTMRELELVAIDMDSYPSVHWLSLGNPHRERWKFSVLFYDGDRYILLDGHIETQPPSEDLAIKDATTVEDIDGKILDGKKVPTSIVAKCWRWGRLYQSPAHHYDYAAHRLARRSP